MAKEEATEMASAEEVPAGYALENLTKMTDAQLTVVLGLDVKLAKFKKLLGDAQALTGKAREYAEQKIADRLAPRMDSYDMDYIISDAQRMAKKDGKTEMADSSPCSCM